MPEPIVKFEGITKRFPGVVALDGVSFSIEEGECHAIVGENGAGKSTLGRILAGIYHPDGGRLIVRGRPVHFHTPLDAASSGVSIVHQELALCPNLTVSENLFLGRMPARRGLLRAGVIRRRSQEMMSEVGLRLAPDVPLAELSTAQEQMVQIAAAVGWGARIVILDEPTSSLSQAEAERLFDVMDRLKRQGVTLIYVSHRLEEIKRLCDRVTVLRDGRHVATHPVAGTTTDRMVRLMIGRAVEEYFPTHVHGTPGAPLLAVDGLTARDRFTDVSFTVRAGEIVGLAGLVGAGRSEIARAIFGIDRFESGRILRNGRPVDVSSPQRAIALGIGLVPEDRKRQALVLQMSCQANLSLSFLDRLRRWRFIASRKEEELAREYFDRLSVRAPSPGVPIEGLSGGNQQKIALAKWLAQRCPVLILDEPTRGVDVGAKAEIHALIDRLAEQGHGVLLISSELPEVLCLSTRILVLAGGRLAGELSRNQANQECIMRLMAGLPAGSTAK